MLQSDALRIVSRIVYANEIQRREADRKSETRRTKLTAPNAHKAKLCQVTRVYFLTDVVTWMFDKVLQLSLQALTLSTTKEDVACTQS